MAVTTDREYGPSIGVDLAQPAAGAVCELTEPGGYKQSGLGRKLGLETLEPSLEMSFVVVSNGSRPINPFGL